MASLNNNLFFTPIVVPQRRAVRSLATAAKGSGGSEEKGILDFILGGLTKQEQFYETDPIFSKDVEDERIGGGSGTTTVSGRKGSVAPPPPQPKKKDGGFGLGGLFAKK